MRNSLVEVHQYSGETFWVSQITNKQSNITLQNIVSSSTLVWVMFLDFTPGSVATVLFANIA
jgi:hypothetical protein